MQYGGYTLVKLRFAFMRLELDPRNLEGFKDFF